MVFSTKDDLNSRKPLSEKLAISTWKYYPDWMLENTMKTASDSGFKYINIGTWLGRNDDGYTILNDELDRITRALDLCKKYHLKPMINFGVDTTPTYHSETGSYYSYKQLKSIKKCITIIFENFADEGIIWNNWNEPNVTWVNDLFGNNVAGMDSWIEMQRWIVNENKYIDNKSINTVSGLANIPGQYRNIIDREKIKGLFSNADAILVHDYIDQQWNKGAPEILMQQGTFPGIRLPLASNEFGYSRYGETGDDWQGFWNDEDAIKLTQREIILQDYLGYAIIGLFCDLAVHTYHLFNENCIGLNQVGRPIMDMVNQLSGYTLIDKVKTTDTDNYMEDLYVFVYANDTKSVKVVYWAPKNTGSHIINIYGAKLKLNFTDSVKIIEPDLTPNQEDYFPTIKKDTSLGTEVI
ncbi:hypothetical protein [Fructilactobacillus fructivorans]|uniref:Uncharacterized protein n=1 Tax=Fructilactobacillus fructivorans TaxID=1614 RepID=A0AAE6TWB5_9LACO|nr:hypothetical protein [Fructilactobacillus fructivorans]QFX92517.1 hypothetical protein LF543_02630 [Fructilactobacillus fructivorans]RDV65888.1 hypothetical protein DXU76_01780 [Fructilactobacillus fructivorans]